MKKTLTVNLGGTVFHIDEDAYRLLDNYLSNLKIHFRKEAGADEIIDDIERRISELFTEKLAAGSQVITIAYVEEVIARMGKPEELEPDAGDAGSGSGSWDGSNHAGSTGAGASATAEKVSHHFYRNPDDTLVMVVGWLLKICLVIFAIICSPLLFVFGVVFVALLFAAVMVAIGGGAALISMFPTFNVVLPASPLSAIVMYIAGILVVGIPLVSLVWMIFSQIFKWQPMVSGLKWTLVILWIVSACVFGICFAMQGATFPILGVLV